MVVTHDAGARWATEPIPSGPIPASAPARRFPDLGTRLDLEAVSAVSCPAAGVCVALGSQGTPAGPAQQQIVLTDNRG